MCRSTHPGAAMLWESYKKRSRPAHPAAVLRKAYHKHNRTSARVRSAARPPGPRCGPGRRGVPVVDARGVGEFFAGSRCLPGVSLFAPAFRVDGRSAFRAGGKIGKRSFSWFV